MIRRFSHMQKTFIETKQRPFSIPNKRWVMTQTWNHLLFCHWPIEEEIIRPLIPAQLELDKFAGETWLGVIPFQVTEMRIHGLPKPPYIHNYIELNIRTYVTYKGTPGIYFLTLDADKWLAVLGGKIGALLPYRKAEMELKEEDHFIQFRSKPIEANQQGSLAIQYRPTSQPYSPIAGSLENWLFERYCFFTTLHNKVLRGDIHHSHWIVSKAEAEVSRSNFGKLNANKHIRHEKYSKIPLQFHSSQEGLFHYVRKKQAFMWKLKLANSEK